MSGVRRLGASRCRAVLAPLAGLALAGCSVFGIRSGYEQPTYDVVERIEDVVEVRAYDGRLAVETVVAGGDTDDARSQAFRRLFDYISGENDGDEEVAMTAPVETGEGSAGLAPTAPVAPSRRTDGMRMRFFLPSDFTMATAPVPRDEAVDLVEVPAATVAVLTFSGRWSETNISARTVELLRAIERSHWQAEGEPFQMFYDPPFTLPWLRRNEVGVEVSPPEA